MNDSGAVPSVRGTSEFAPQCVATAPQPSGVTPDVSLWVSNDRVRPSGMTGVPTEILLKEMPDTGIASGP